MNKLEVGLSSSEKLEQEIGQRDSTDSKIDALMQAASEEEYRFVVTRVPELFLSIYAQHDCPELEDFQIDMFRLARENRRVVILVPKGHGKSTLMLKWLPILELCTNPNGRIIAVAKNEPEANKYSDNIRAELESNEALLRDFGTFRSAKWGRSFNIAQRTLSDPSLSFMPFGWNGKYLGVRCDLLIADDIVDDKNSDTQVQRDKLIERFRAAAQTCPQYKWPYMNPACRWEDSSANLKVPEGIYWPRDINYERVVVCGTRFHPHDLYRKLAGDAHLRGGDESFRAMHYDCWKDAEQTIPLWPGFWTKRKLDDEKKSLGLVAFNKRYRNIVLDESEIGFREEWIFGGELGGEEFSGCVDRNRAMGELPAIDLYKITGFDPASGSTSRFSTAPSFVCLGYNQEAAETERVRYVIDILSLRSKDMDDIMDVFLDGNAAKGLPGFRRKYDYQMAVIETNAYGTFFANNRRLREAQLRGLLVKEHWTQSNKMDPMDGVLTMQEIFKRGLVSIPYADDGRTRLKADEFITQILEWPKGINDFLMAFWFAELQIRRQTMQRGTVHRLTPGRRWKAEHWIRP